MKFTRIKGETPRNIIRLPRLNKIRLGVKKVSAKTGKEFPTEVDYFVVPPEVQAKYGPTPKSLPVMVPVEDEEMFLRQYYAVYGGNQKLKCQGDGETAERRGDKGEIAVIKCPSPEGCDFGRKFKCNARTEVMLVLPEINCGGVYQLSTGSIHSDIQIRSGLEMARHLFGRISWVPMLLVREEQKILDPTTGNMQPHWPVKLYPVATVAEVNQIRQDTTRILERQKNFALPEPIMEGPLTDTPVEVFDDAIETSKVEAPAITKELLMEKIAEVNTKDDLQGFIDWSTANKPLIEKTISKDDRELAANAFKRKHDEIEKEHQQGLFVSYESALKSAVRVEDTDKIMEIVEKSLKSNELKVRLKFLRDSRVQELKKKKGD